MTTYVSPFSQPALKPGHGVFNVSLLPPAIPTVRQLSYSYPLKLIVPASSIAPSNHSVALLYLLSYGGGLLPNDHINLDVRLDQNVRLILLTQGSTKIFPLQDSGCKNLGKDVGCSQYLNITLCPNAAFCYLPDPVQPFATSAFTQKQLFNVIDGEDSSLCVLDWVTEGRSARGEKWDFLHWSSRNEIWSTPRSSPTQASPSSPCMPYILLRDNMCLSSSSRAGPIISLMEDLGIIGTLILYGPLFATLGTYFLAEFAALPRLGTRNWAPKPVEVGKDVHELRLEMEKANGIIWTAAKIRECVLVKFGAKKIEGAKCWLHGMIGSEGSVEREFGERALMCLR